MHPFELEALKNHLSVLRTRCPAPTSEGRLGSRQPLLSRHTDEHAHGPRAGKRKLPPNHDAEH